MGAMSEELRRAWRERPVGECERTERVWGAVDGSLSVGERRELAEHAIGCAACAEAWRLAAALTSEASTRRRPAWHLIAAATLVAAAGLAGWGLLGTSQSPAPVVERDSAVVTIESLLEEEAALPREAFELVWSGAPAGSHYDVEVGTTDLRVVARATALETPRFTVPAEDLAELPAGARIAWRVVATLPDGRRVESLTFINRIR